MNFCPECGSKIEENSKVCQFCGYSFTSLSKTESSSDKDKRIQELEKKIARLEKSSQSKQKSSGSGNENTPWVFITPIAFAAIFFLFVFMIIFITR